MTADVTYANELTSAIKISGGYEGTVVEGAPSTSWMANVAYAYDASSRPAKEDLTVTAFSKTYKQKPYGAERDEVNKLYDRMRVGRPIENILAPGDRCATSGTTIPGTAIAPPRFSA